MGALLGFLATGFNGLIVILVSSVLSLLGGVYFGHNYEKNYYEAKISKDALEKSREYEKALAEDRAKKDFAIGQLFKALQDEQAKSSSYQSQAKAIRMANTANGGSSVCCVNYGFIRLFNASATGQNTEPVSSDAITSTIDLDTVLAAIIDNHGKYRQAAGQIDAIRASE